MNILAKLLDLAVEVVISFAARLTRLILCRALGFCVSVNNVQIGNIFRRSGPVDESLKLTRYMDASANT